MMRSFDLQDLRPQRPVFSAVDYGRSLQHLDRPNDRQLLRVPPRMETSPVSAARGSEVVRGSKVAKSIFQDFSKVRMG